MITVLLVAELLFWSADHRRLHHFRYMAAVCDGDGDIRVARTVHSRVAAVDQSVVETLFRRFLGPIVG